MVSPEEIERVINAERERAIKPLCARIAELVGEVTQLTAIIAMHERIGDTTLTSLEAILLAAATLHEKDEAEVDRLKRKYNLANDKLVETIEMIEYLITKYKEKGMVDRSSIKHHLEEIISSSFTPQNSINEHKTRVEQLEQLITSCSCEKWKACARHATGKCRICDGETYYIPKE